MWGPHAQRLGPPPPPPHTKRGKWISPLLGCFGSPRTSNAPWYALLKSCAGTRLLELGVSTLLLQHFYMLFQLCVAYLPCTSK